MNAPESAVREEAVQQIAARLANTGQVMKAWCAAIDEGQDVLLRRLQRAVRDLEDVVGALTVPDEEFLAMEQGRTLGKTFEIEPDAPEEVVATNDPENFGLRGRSEMISLVEMVAFLSSLGRDGTLQVQSDNEDYIVELENGLLTYITVSPKSDTVRLGEILIAQGALSRPELELGETEAAPDEFLGEALVRQGLVTLEELKRALAQHALMIFTQMHKVGTGFNFQFEEGAKILLQKDIRLGVSGLLLESARILDEERRDRSHADEWESVLGGTPEPEEAEDALDVLDAGEEPDDQPEARNEGEAETEDDDDTEPDDPVAQEEETEADECSPLEMFREALEVMISNEELMLPVLPETTGQLLALLWSDDIDNEELTRWVNRDQALCAHVLRVANSASFAPRSPITSVQMAIARLGLDKLREVVMALTLKQSLFQVEGWETVVKRLWRRAAITSGFGAAVGKSCAAGATRGGMLGLLLDVGKPIVLYTLQSIEKELDIELTPAIAEELMEEYHSELGERLVGEWHLPDWISTVVQHHDAYASAKDHKVEVMVGNLAHRISDWAEDGGLDPDVVESLEVCKDLGLSAREVRHVVEELDRIREFARIYA